MGNSNKGITPPKGVISIKDGIKLNDEWTKTRKAAMDRCIQHESGGKIKEDNRSSWWSLEDLEDYILYARRLAKEEKFEVTGFRVYCGAHSKSCYSTSFIVPTGKSLCPEKNIADDDGDGDLPIGPLNDGVEGDPPGIGYTGG